MSRSVCICLLLAALLPAQTPRKLTTLFQGTNTGIAGWGLFFDVDVTTEKGLVITALETNVAESALPATVEIYVCPETYVGNERNVPIWQRAAIATGTAAGLDNPTLVTLSPPLALQPGSYGLALYHQGITPRYTNGNGSNQEFVNVDVGIHCGIVLTGLFNGFTFSPRVWNGSLLYQVPPNAAAMRAYGSGCTGSNGAPVLARASGSWPKLGTTLQLELSRLPTTSGGFSLLLGTSSTLWGTLPLPFDLTPLGMTGCTALVGIEASLFGIRNAGKGTLAVAIPNAPALLGRALFFQGFVPDQSANPFGATTSNAAGAILGQ